MSNMTREALEKIYSTYNIVFLNIQKEAAKLHVDLEIDIDEDGKIKLSAKDYTDSEFTRWYELSQDEECISYEEHTFKRNK